MTGTVVIEPWPPLPGRKKIMVDGVQWGTIFMESHGPRGNHYWFSQGGGTGGAILDPDDERRPGSRRTVKVESWKVNGRPGTTDRERSLAEQLHATARLLIERGLLVNPDVVRTRQAAAKLRAQAREDAERAERRARDLEKIRPLLAKHDITTADARASESAEPLAEAIADLIEEARSKAI